MDSKIRAIINAVVVIVVVIWVLQSFGLLGDLSARRAHPLADQQGGHSPMGLVLLIVLLLLLFGGLPRWGYHSYGYRPSGIVGVILVVVLILFLLGRL